MATFASRLQALEDGGSSSGLLRPALREPGPAPAPPPAATPEPFEPFDPFAPSAPTFQQEPLRAGPVTPSRSLPPIEEPPPRMGAFGAPPSAVEPPPFEMDPYADHLRRPSEPPPFEDDSFLSGPLPARGPGRLSPEIRDDYLNAVRKAAQSQSGGKGRKDKGDKGDKASKGDPGLRGGNRVVFWGAAGAVAAALAGAAYYVNANSASTLADAGEPEADPLGSDAEDVFGPVETAGVGPTALDPNGLGGAIDGLSLGPADAAAAGIPAPAAPSVAPTGAPAVATPASAPAPARAAPVTSQPISLQQAATRGDPVAQYELALQNLAAGDSAEALSLLRASANQGLAMAQYRLAKMFERGEGVPADLAQARQWTERAAAAGNSRAMHDLGVFFARGEGAPLDEAAAFRWFRQAAELGVEDSQFNLGVLYQQGRGTSVNGAEALFWFLVVGANGDADARARAATLEAQLSPSEVAQARARAEAFRPRAASARANGDFGPRAWAN
jgi:localization factor PodJL